jgi:hypothetical protein
MLINVLFDLADMVAASPKINVHAITALINAGADVSLLSDMDNSFLYLYPFHIWRKRERMRE